MCVWDPVSGIQDTGSGINIFRIPDPDPGGQKGTRSRIRIRTSTLLKWQRTAGKGGGAPAVGKVTLRTRRPPPPN
jgi:hypothetical protein